MALPKLQVYTTDKTSPRSFPWLWYLRLPAIVFSIVVLGITGVNHATFNNSGCSSPSKLSFNLAVAVISFVILIYLILAAGPSPKTRLLPWVVYGQLALDAFLFVLWLAAASSSRYNCNDLCSACDSSEVYYDNLLCYCYDVFYKRDQSLAPKGILDARRIKNSATGYSSTADARKAFDAIMTLIFFACVVADLFWIFTASRSSNTATTPAPTGTAPYKQEEVGMTAPAAGVPMGDHHPGASSEYYNGQPMQQQQAGYQQPPMTQGQHPEGQYSPQYPQGQPQQPYHQTQAMPPQQQVPQQGIYTSP